MLRATARGVATVALLALAGLGAFAGETLGACPNEQIRQEQGATDLPRCMAYEQATPARKEGQEAIFAPAFNPGYDPTLSADGRSVLYLSRAALGGTSGLTNPLGDPYVAKRGEAGWGSVAIAPPVGTFAAQYNAKVFSPDLGRWINFLSTASQYDRGWFTAFEGSAAGWRQRSVLVKALSVAPSPENLLLTAGAVLGASTDLSHVYFRPGVEAATYFDADPSPSGPAAHAHTYVVGEDSGGSPTFELLTRDSEGVVWGEACGAWVGGGEITASDRGGREQGAVSADGSRVFFSTRLPREGKPNLPQCDAGNQIRILERRQGDEGGVEIVPLTPVEPQGGDDLYQGAGLDGELVYFTTSRSLAASDLDGPGLGCNRLVPAPGCDLYVYDRSLPEGERLLQASAGEPGSPAPGLGAGLVSGVTAISGDGSRAYFVAAGVLTTEPNPEGDLPVEGGSNLYAYHHRAGAGEPRIRFVGTLAGSDSGRAFGVERSFRSGEAVPLFGTDGSSGGAGDTLVFITAADLIAADADGGRADVYRYESGSAPRLECISCAPGGPDAGAFDVASRSLGSAVPRLSQFGQAGRWASEDGNTVAFGTAQPLADGDIDGVENPYLWFRDGLAEGQVRLPAERTAEAVIPLQIALSGDGGTVAFETTSRLVPGDGDLVGDVYVARSGGGFTSSSLPGSCLAEACQGPPAVAPPNSPVGTAGLAGRGNARPAVAKKKKPSKRKSTKRKVRKSGKAKRRCQRQKPGSVTAGQRACRVRSASAAAQPRPAMGVAGGERR